MAEILPFRGLSPAEIRRVRLGYARAKGTHSALDWEILKWCFGRCVRCRAELPLTKDHVIPISVGGCDCITNIQPLCLSCNASKGGQEADYRYRDWAIQFICTREYQDMPDGV